MQHHKILFTLALCGMAIGGFAQNNNNNDKGITDNTVTVTQAYEAVIQDAQKVNLQPNIPEVEDSKTKLDYSVPSKNMKDFGFEPGPMKPIGMGEEKLERYNTSYIKLGFGSQIAPLAQLAYNDTKTKNLKFGLFYNHISAIGYKNKLQRYSDDELGAYVKYFPKKVEVGGGLTFHNYRTHFYGIDTAFYGADSVFKAKDQRQVYRTYDAMIYLKNAQANKYNINYGQTLNFNFFQETYDKATEWYIAGKTNVDKRFGKYHTAYANLDFDISRWSNRFVTDSIPPDSVAVNKQALSRLIITPTVGYGFNNDDWRGYANFGIAIFNGGSRVPVAGKSKILFVTNIHLQKRLYMDNLIAFVGYERRYQKNSFSSLMQTNNFITDHIDILNSPVDDFKAGVKGTIENFSYNASFNLVRIKNFALFVNDSIDNKRFTVLYDPSTWIYNVHYELGYNTKEWLRLLVMGDLNLYDMKEQSRPWGEPVFKTTIRGNYVWKNKLSVGADIYVMTGSYALQRKIDGTNTEKRLGGTVDLNVNASYVFSKHLSFFVSGNNLLNIKYQRWNNYRSFGASAMIGAKYAF